MSIFGSSFGAKLGVSFGQFLGVRFWPLLGVSFGARFGGQFWGKFWGSVFGSVLGFIFGPYLDKYGGPGNYFLRARNLTFFGQARANQRAPRFFCGAPTGGHLLAVGVSLEAPGAAWKGAADVELGRDAGGPSARRSVATRFHRVEPSQA